MVDEEIERCIAGEPEAEDASVLSSFVRAWYQLKLQKNPDYLRGTRVRIANDMFLFTFAAITNSYPVVAWVLFHAIRNTGGVGDRIRAELTKVDVDDSESLPEMEKAINEVARLYSPGTLMRLVNAPFKVPSTGDVISPGSLVAFSVAAAHRNPEAFSNPLDFDPTRFDEGRDERLGSARGMFLTFGAGAHPCVGRKFALLEIALFCSEALQHFDWNLVGDETREEDPYTQSMISNVPRHPKLDIAQTHSTWHVVEPVLVQYKRKAASQHEVL
jgi:cytochrome P450